MENTLVLTIVVWVGVFLLVWLKSKIPSLKGNFGERFVSKKLFDLDPEHYRVLDDLLLPSHGSTQTTQIDHVVVSNYGIFCIETKFYSGWIFGNARQQYWTQVIYRHKEKFYNPLWQNYGHIKALEVIIRPVFPKALIKGFVAFPAADKIRVTGTTDVGFARDIVSNIRIFRTPILTDAERDKIFHLLNAANIENKDERKEHIRNVRAIKNSKGF